ncbi:hypothetical protein BH11BAC2_BH11BAC2_04280 [soil metagenome]
MKQLLLCFSIVFFTVIAQAQKYGNVWQFGDHVGLDFNNCNPVVVNGSNPGFEGCSTICDSLGQILFYTNSDSVWDRFNNVMPNGFLIFTSGTLSQVIIIPKPLSSNLYYILTTIVQGNNNLTLQYHLVDMALNGGAGDVISKNNTLSSLIVTEQIAATYHSNGTDIWVLTHEYGTSNFLSYLVTSNGISPTPVITNIGPAHNPCVSNINARGEIKFSPDGTKVAYNANGIGGADSSNILALFDFNNTSGAISNPIILPFSRGEFGLSFSPDNSKLYGATWKAFNFSINEYNYLYQFDLSSGIPSTISNSKQLLDSTQVPKSYGSLKLGPDGKIYVATYAKQYLGVINSPNLSGIQCNYTSSGLYLGGKLCKFSLNNYIEYTTYCTNTSVPIISHSDNEIKIIPNPFSTQTVFYTANGFQNTKLTVYNYFGQKVKEMIKNSGQTITFSRDDLPSGIYFVQITQDNKIVTLEKIVITD